MFWKFVAAKLRAHHEPHTAVCSLSYTSSGYLMPHCYTYLYITAVCQAGVRYQAGLGVCGGCIHCCHPNIWTSSSARMFFRQTGQTRFQTSDHGRQPGQQVAIQSLDMDGLGVSQQLLQAAWTWQKCGLLQLLLQTTPLNKSRQQQQLTTTSWFSWQPSWSTLETRMLFNKAVARVLIWRAAHPLPASMRTSGPRPLN